MILDKISSLKDDMNLLFNKFFELKIDLDSLICENTDIEVSFNKSLLHSNNISAFTTKSSKRNNPSLSPIPSPIRAKNNSIEYVIVDNDNDTYDINDIVTCHY